MIDCAKCGNVGLLVGVGGVVDCECKKARQMERAIERSGIPPRYRDKTFESYNPGVSLSASAALMIARGYVNEWPMRPGMGLLFTGTVGVGKTHLTAVMLRECLIRWNAKIMFVDLPELFTRIKATFDTKWHETEFEVLKPILAAEILAVDEIGAARQSDWSYAMTEHILNSRYNANRSTLLTTNYPNHPSGYAPPRSSRPAAADDFAARAAAPLAMSARRETLGDRIGDRMWSRVQEMCGVVEIVGADQRLNAARRQG